jgi:hypothetical protein
LETADLAGLLAGLRNVAVALQPFTAAAVPVAEPVTDAEDDQEELAIGPRGLRYNTCCSHCRAALETAREEEEEDRENAMKKLVLLLSYLDAAAGACEGLTRTDLTPALDGELTDEDLCLLEHDLPRIKRELRWTTQFLRDILPDDRLSAAGLILP